MKEAEKCHKALDGVFEEIEASNFHEEFIDKFLNFIRNEFTEVTIAEIIHVIVSIYVNYIQDLGLPTIDDEEEFALLLIKSGYQHLKEGKGRDLHFGPSPGDG